MARTVAPALAALLDGLIDYAGLFPPASLTCAATVDHYRRYTVGPHAWMLRWLVVRAADLPHVPAEFDAQLAVLAEADEARAAVIEAKSVLQLSRPVYCEVARSELDAVKQAGAFAKLRTGSVTPDAIPTISDVASFITACAERRLPFKATAGLHHPVRAVQALTYASDSPRALMHGFLNVFLAAAFAWHGERDLEPIIAETDPAAFRFDERAHWRDRSLAAVQVRQVRTEFAHSFGSCSFEEPVRDLEALGLL